MVASQGFGPGVLLCGTGLIGHGPLLVAAGRHASGNVQVQVRRLADTVIDVSLILRWKLMCVVGLFVWTGIGRE